jgi:hypothetical protein
LQLKYATIEWYESYFSYLLLVWHQPICSVDNLFSDMANENWNTS